MKQTQFINARKADWQLLEREIEGSDKNTDFIDLPALLRAVTHDLAISKSRSYSPDLVNKLNTLVTSAQAKMYQPKHKVWYELLRFMRVGFPLSVFQLKRAVIINHFLFYGLALVAYLLTIYKPELIYQFVDNFQVSNIESMYNPESKYRLKERASSGDFAMFGFYIFNNIKLAFQTFVGGLVLGVGALFFLIFNGFFFGAISAHIVNIGYQSTFFSFVITHGSFELTAIVLSAAAGTHIGYSLLNPGRLSRSIAVKQAAKRAFPVMFGAFIFLIIAAFIEAFWSSSLWLPNSVKYTVGACCWIFIAIYFYRGHKHAAR
ncbi:stage II sporulation protein M [Catenovulum sp. 2E275]|uniref:stage II sporulation protein M n=1 Tax=Catenovulum sp. 2E275 TaxID=2980497 RepID=UPI0021D0A639|nr:stage II sporulation protein M [Catenovulum sp. 2E275]MCU4675271.1 stage II sporulation protein M [Catenovulum sp. 2E275]